MKSKRISAGTATAERRTRISCNPGRAGSRPVTISFERRQSVSRSAISAPILLILVALMAAAGANTVGARSVESAMPISASAPVEVSEGFPTTAAVDYVRVATTEKWGDVAVIVVPPSPGDVPSVSTEVAVATCNNGSACGSIDQLPAIRLGRATTAEAGTLNADGSLKTPVMDDTLVFEMIWTGEQCLPVVGTSTRAPDTTLHYFSCTTIAWVDATTGEALFGLTDAE